MKKKIMGILVCTLLMLTSLTFVSALSATEHETTSFDSEVSIVKPNGYVYIFNIQIVPLPSMMPFRAIVIGMVDVEVEVEDGSVDKVEFYVDDDLKDTVTEAPYEWTWNERLTPPPIHSLKVVGYADDEEIGRDEIRVLYVNPFLFGP